MVQLLLNLVCKRNIALKREGDCFELISIDIKFTHLNICFAVHVVIATPGRILDLMNKNLVKIGHCGTLILDEVSDYRNGELYKMTFFSACRNVLNNFFSNMHKFEIRCVHEFNDQRKSSYGNILSDL